jgi:hypothetical protein
MCSCLEVACVCMTQGSLSLCAPPHRSLSDHHAATFPRGLFGQAALVSVGTPAIENSHRKGFPLQLQVFAGGKGKGVGDSTTRGAQFSLSGKRWWAHDGPFPPATVMQYALGWGGGGGGKGCEGCWGGRTGRHPPSIAPCPVPVPRAPTIPNPRTRPCQSSAVWVEECVQAFRRDTPLPQSSGHGPQHRSGWHDSILSTRS